MKADVVVRGNEALVSVLRSGDASLGRVFALGCVEAPLDVILLPDGGWNRGILLRERDVALVDGAVNGDWLAEMLRTLHTSDRIASVSKGHAVLLRHWVLHVIGAFDPAATDPFAEWQTRAQRLGLVARRLS